MTRNQMTWTLIAVLSLCAFLFGGLAALRRDRITLKEENVLPLEIAVDVAQTEGDNHPSETGAQEETVIAQEEMPAEVHLEESDEQQPVTLMTISARTGNIRTGPGTEYVNIEEVKRGVQFYASGKTEVATTGRTWYEVYIQGTSGKTGWASEWVITGREDLVRILAQSPEQDTVNLRSGPDKGAYEVVEVLDNGEIVFATGQEQVSKENVRWYEVYLDGEWKDTAWISSRVSVKQG